MSEFGICDLAFEIFLSSTRNGGSFNGRTVDSGSTNRGSTPCPPDLGNRKQEGQQETLITKKVTKE